MSEHSLGFPSGQPVALIESRPSVSSQQGFSRQQLLLDELEKHSVSSVLVDVGGIGQNGITKYYTRDSDGNDIVHQLVRGYRLEPSASHIRNFMTQPDSNGDVDDPLGIGTSNVMNPLAARYQFAIRPRQLEVFRAIGLPDLLIPSAVVDGHTGFSLREISELGSKLIIKPFRVNDMSMRREQRPHVIPNSRTAIDKILQMLQGRAVIQPVLNTISAAHIAAELQHKLDDKEIPPDALHAVRIHHHLQFDHQPQVAETRISTVAQSGHPELMASWLSNPEDLYARFDGLQASCDRLQRHLQEEFGSNLSIASNWLILVDGSPRLVNVDCRAFTPSIIRKSHLDLEQYELARTLVRDDAQALAHIAVTHFERHPNVLVRG